MNLLKLGGRLDIRLNPLKIQCFRLFFGITEHLLEVIQ